MKITISMCIEAKTCTNCGGLKKLTEFNRDKRRADGYHSQCKVCIRAYYKRNRDRILSKKADQYQVKKAAKVEQQRNILETKWQEIQSKKRGGK